MRKRVFKKYLELDLQFYDQDMNSPGSLLTKLSIDTTKISAIVLSVFGSIISAIGGIIISIVLGLIFDCLKPILEQMVLKVIMI